MRKLTTEKFIQRSIKTHGHRYDYSKVAYERCTSRVSIRCLIHGPFLQQPRLHLLGRNCPKCGAMQSNKGRTVTTDQFIKRAIECHGNKYNYCNVIYKNHYTPVKIVCQIHGDFEQTPMSHLKGSNCPTCAIESTRMINSGDTEDFLNKAHKIHGNKYDYTKVKYRHSCSDVIIVCSEHGEFFQKPYHHLEGHGCPGCALASSKKQPSTLTTELFIKKAILIHGNIYDYTKAVYKNAKSKVVITCTKHGDFNMRSSTHLEGQGCPNCCRSKGELKIALWLKRNNVSYVPQATFPDCRGKKYPLRFDFFLPQYNTCIEFDGSQHRSISTFFCKDRKRATQYFENVQLYDSIKNVYCADKGIKLIRINHSLIKFNPEKKLDLILKDYKTEGKASA